MELVLDDGTGRRAVPQGEAALWIARCLLDAGAASPRSEAGGSDPDEGGGVGSALCEEGTPDAAILSTWIRQWTCLGRENGPLTAGTEVRISHPDGLEPPLSPGQTEAQGVRLTVLSGPDSGRCLEVPRGTSRLGRSGELRLSDPAVSRSQAEVTAAVSGLRLRALPGGAPVLTSTAEAVSVVGHRAVPLSHGDEIAAGQSRLRVALAGPHPPSVLPLPELLKSLPSSKAGVGAERARSTASGQTSTLRTLFLWVPLAASAIAAVAMGRPSVLLFGLLSLGAALPATVERIRSRAEKDRRSQEAVALRRTAARAAFPPPVLALTGDLPTAEARLRVSETGSLRACLGPWVLGDPSPAVGPSTTGSLGAATEDRDRVVALLRLGTWWGASAPTPAAPVEAGLIWTAGEPLDLRLTSTDPSATLLALVCSAAVSPSAATQVWVHPEDVPIAVLQSPRVSTHADDRAIHLCCAEDCPVSTPARIHIRQGRDLQPVSGIQCRLVRHQADEAEGPAGLCVDHLIQDDFERILTAAYENDTGSPSEAVAPAPGGAGLPLEEVPVSLWTQEVPSALQTAAHRRLCLVRDGPHVLAVGTTGCGKTELLTALILNLAWTHAPDELRFFLIDFKGGSGFAPLAVLPHVDQVLSNLEAGDVQRVLISLAAEIERRERWLAARGHPDLPSAISSGAEGAPPRFAVVVDELKALVDSDPEASSVLARIAALGRSLGIHLVLATQRAQGAASQELRANISTTVVLRVATATDSRDALGSTAAASIPPGAPGALFLQSGGQIEGPYRAACSGEVLPRERLALSRWPCSPASTQEPVPLQVQTERIRERWGGRWTDRSWPAPVAPRLPPYSASESSDAPVLADDPGRQRVLSVTGPHRSALLYGQPGDVLHSALTGLARSALARRPDPQLVCLAEPSPATQWLCSAAHSWAAPGDALDVSELLDSLPPPGPGTVFVVASLDVTAEILRGAGVTTGEERLGAVITRTIRAGGTVLATSLRDPGRAGSAFESWAYLPLGVGPSITAAWPRLPSLTTRPGAALLRGEWHTAEAGLLPLEHAAQFLCPREEAHSPALARTSKASGFPRGFRPLPADAVARGLPLSARAATPAKMTLGVDALGVEHAIELGQDSPFLILGGPGSGRSSALRMLHSRLGERSELLSARQTEPRLRLERLRSGPFPDVLLVDDAEDLSPAEWDALAACASSLPVVLSCLAGPQLRLGRLGPLAGSRIRALVLSPRGPLEAEALGRRVIPFPEFSPGAGWLLGQGPDTRIRVFHPPGPPQE